MLLEVVDQEPVDEFADGHVAQGLVVAGDAAPFEPDPDRMRPRLDQ